MKVSIKTLDSLLSDARSRFEYPSSKEDWSTTTMIDGTILVYFRGQVMERYRL